MTLRDATSRSSSCSSLDNLAVNEGISFIAVNDYAFSLNANIKNGKLIFFIFVFFEKITQETL